MWYLLRGLHQLRENVGDPVEKGTQKAEQGTKDAWTKAAEGTNEAGKKVRGGTQEAEEFAKEVEV